MDIAGKHSSALDATAVNLQSVRLMHMRGELAAAEAGYRALINSGSNDPQCFAAFAALLGTSGRGQEAVPFLQRAIELRPDFAEAHINLGNIALAQGDAGCAARSYQAALSAAPTFALAAYNLGNALKQLGDVSGAIAAFRRALEIKPDLAEAHANLGSALMDLGRFGEAMDSLRRALLARPTLNSALINLGRCLEDQGELQAASECFSKAVAAQPRSVKAHIHLGNVLKKTGQAELAISTLRRALILDPTNADCHYFLGLALHEKGDVREATELYGQVIAMAPSHRDVGYNLGLALQDQGRIDDAIAAYRRAIALNPRFAEAHTNLGMALVDQGAYAEAVECYRTALDINPHLAETHNNLGSVLQETGRLVEAEACYQRALDCQADFSLAAHNLSMCRMLRGDFESGWRLFDARTQHLKGLLHPPSGMQRWNEDLDYRGEIVLLPEQGLGDTIQFIRYGAELANKGLNVALAAPAKLRALIAGSRLYHEVYTEEEIPRKSWVTQRWFPLMSVPRILGADFSKIPPSTAYLRAEASRVRYWNSRIRSGKFTVGIVWQGSPSAEKGNLKGRSVPLEFFSTIAELPYVSLLALQKGAGSEQLAQCSFADRFVACQAEISAAWDFEETAAIIENCDLIISTCTSSAHLAAALGKPTWIVLKHVPDWRWMMGRSDSIFYQSVRLFRQATHGEWLPVFAAVRAALVEMIAAANAPAS